MENTKTNNVLMVFAIGYLIWFAITTFIYPHEYAEMKGIMISSASIFLVTSLCMIANKSEWRMVSISAYGAVTFLIGAWLVHDYQWNQLSMMIWIPVIACIVTGMAKISVRWIEGFLLGFWALTALYFFTIPTEDTMMAFRISLSYHGTQYALKHYWALLLIMAAYGYIQNKWFGDRENDNDGISVRNNYQRTEHEMPKPMIRYAEKNESQQRADNHKVQSEEMKKEL